LIISGENLTVNGDLTVYEDISLVFDVLGSQGNNLSRFFCIESEKPLFEIKSCKEVLYNSQW